MSHSEYTENYKLARFIDTDQPTFLGDWNETMDDIDGAIKGVADKETTLGNTVSALILRVDDHDGRIGTLEDATEELESKTEDLQTKYDSIKTATATTAGLVKLSDSTTGTATDTALSQKGAANLATSIASGGSTSPKVVHSETLSVVKGVFTRGQLDVSIIENPLTKQFIFSGVLHGTEGVVSTGPGGVQVDIGYILPEGKRPSRDISILFAASTTAAATATTSIDITTDGAIQLDMYCNAAVDNHGLNGNAVMQYGVTNA